MAWPSIFHSAREFFVLEMLMSASSMPDNPGTVDATATAPQPTSDWDRVPPKPAVHFPGYEILQELGRGSMGVVYLARQTGLDRLVALKVLEAGQFASEMQLARFRVEGAIIAHLRHPNVIQIHDYGEIDGSPYFSLEYANPGSLANHIGHPHPVKEAARLIATLAQTVHYAHECSIIHRDLKPSNILLVREERTRSETPIREDEKPTLADLIPKIADFGLAKRLDASVVLTASGGIFGTPRYMSPEQAAGRTHQVGPAADVWALGVILYELLTGRVPFKAELLSDLLKQVCELPPILPRRLRRDVPADLEAACLRCLEKEPAQRYPTAQALAEELQRFLIGQPIQTRRPRWWRRPKRWTKRHPATTACMAAILLILLLAGTWWGGYHWGWRAREHSFTGEGVLVPALIPEAVERAARLRLDMIDEESKQRAAELELGTARAEVERVRPQVAARFRLPSDLENFQRRVTFLEQEVQKHQQRIAVMRAALTELECDKK
jgi:serine/threonine protein kinase